MSTSGTYVFTVNRDQIIRDAMLNIGKLDPYEAPSAMEVSDCAFKLNMLIKQWMGKTDFAPGLKVWTRKRGYLFLNSTSGQYQVGQTATGWTNSFTSTTTTAQAAASQKSIVVASATGITIGYYIGVELVTGALQWSTVSNVVGTTVTLADNLAAISPVGSQVYCYQTAGTQPLQIETAVLRDNNNQDTPLKIMRTVQEYDPLPNKADPTNVADPVSIYYENQLGNSNLFTDCGAANDVTKYIVLTYLEPIQDMNSAADNFEYPQEWFLALSLGLSKLIAPMFKAKWTPELESSLKDAMAIAGHKDAEQSAFFFQCGEDG